MKRPRRMRSVWPLTKSGRRDRVSATMSPDMSSPSKQGPMTIVSDKNGLYSRTEKAAWDEGERWMKTRRFGRTGLEVPELVMGGGWVGGIRSMPTRTRHEQFVSRSTPVSTGSIRQMTTGRANPRKRSAESWRHFHGKRPLVSTKVRLDLESGVGFETQIRDSIETSLERLGLQKVLFQLHNPIVPTRTGQWVSVDDVLGPGGIADLLDKVRDDGLADNIGFTALGDTASLCQRDRERAHGHGSGVLQPDQSPAVRLTELGGFKVQISARLLAACQGKRCRGHEYPGICGRCTGVRRAARARDPHYGRGGSGRRANPRRCDHGCPWRGRGQAFAKSSAVLPREPGHRLCRDRTCRNGSPGGSDHSASDGTAVGWIPGAGPRSVGAEFRALAV